MGFSLLCIPAATSSSEEEGAAGAVGHLGHHMHIVEGALRPPFTLRMAQSDGGADNGPGAATVGAQTAAADAGVAAVVGQTPAVGEEAGTGEQMEERGDGPGSAALAVGVREPRPEFPGLLGMDAAADGTLIFRFQVGLAFLRR
jgi:hypothetical protein